MRDKPRFLAVLGMVAGLLLCITSSASGDVFQAVAVGVKGPSMMHDNASLNGTYQFRNLSVRDIEGTEADTGVTQASVVFDGAGNWSAAYTELGGEGGSESGTYRVSGNSFDFTETGGTGVDILILDFSDLGLYAFDLNQWTLITGVDCEGMIVALFD